MRQAATVVEKESLQAAASRDYNKTIQITLALDFVFLGYDAASLGTRFPTFQGNVYKDPLDGNLRHTAAKILKIRTSWLFPNSVYY